MPARGDVVIDGDVNVLACPGCHYDLRGLPDGVCPECGRGFTRAELLATFERGRLWSWRDRRVAMFGWAMGIWTGLVLLFLRMPELTHHWGRDAGSWGTVWDLESRAGMLVVLWVFTLLWSIHWLVDRPKRPLALLWVWLPTLRTALLLAALRRDEYRVLLAVEVLIGLAILAWPFWREPHKSAWITATLSAGLAMLLGIAYLLSGLERQARREWWSVWEDFRSGQVYDQYPLTNREAVVFGIGLLVIAAGAGLVLWRTRRRVWAAGEG